MDNNLDSKVTVLEHIIREVSMGVYEKWLLITPEDQRTEEAIENLKKNALDTTFYVVQNFMSRFNEAAEQLKSTTIDETQGN